jgi:D-glycerate 3-kinase
MAKTTSSPGADWRQAFLEQERLPAAYLDTAQRFFDPLASLLAARHSARGRPLLVAVNGSQGSGKSTLCAYLVARLTGEHGLSAVALSLDDFYLTRKERRQLADAVHPLLATRGVPGTHDIALLRQCLGALQQESGGVSREVLVPRFDKAADDRHAREHWTRCTAPQDIVLLEGWCLGARRESDEALKLPLNALERDEDPQGAWRHHVNEALRRDLEPLYPQFDLWVMLAAPSFDAVYGWRREQEEKLRAATAGGGAGIMDASALERFVAHFERQTRNCLRELPSRADILFQLDGRRRIVASRGLEL